LYEHRHEPLLPRIAFLNRLLNHAAGAAALIFLSLGAGILGYHVFEKLSWLDSFLNASMILGGMGPVNELRSLPGKLFAGFYALYAGVVFLAVAGIVFAPVFHRFLHRFHFDPKDGRSPAPDKSS
jgi:hypothetical protein